MIGVYSPYPSEKDYMKLVDTMLVVLREAHTVSNLKTLANDEDRRSAQRFAANCIMVMRNVINSLNEWYSENDKDTQAELTHNPDEGWSVDFHKSTTTNNIGERND